MANQNKPLSDDERKRIQEMFPDIGTYTLKPGVLDVTSLVIARKLLAQDAEIKKYKQLAFDAAWENSRVEEPSCQSE